MVMQMVTQVLTHRMLPRLTMTPLNDSRQPGQIQSAALNFQHKPELPPEKGSLVCPADPVRGIPV
jgi:hypothetical protein